MRGFVRTTAIAAAVICLAGCSKKQGEEFTPMAPDTLAVATDTQVITQDTVAVAVDTLPITYYTLTDKRDGQKYRTVIMPDGKTWMAQNLNYRTPNGSSCYNDSLSYCKKYGRLYDWNAARKACPAGWRVPSYKDWVDLFETAGGNVVAGKNLKAKGDWNDWNDEFGKKHIGTGTDIFGFSALPGGYHSYKCYGSDCSDYVGILGFWWVSDGSSNMEGTVQIFYASAVYTMHARLSDYDGEFSIRCVQNSP